MTRPSEVNYTENTKKYTSNNNISLLALSHSPQDSDLMTHHVVLFVSHLFDLKHYKRESRAVAGNPRDAAVIFDP